MNICFSGSSYSGKTHNINKIKTSFPEVTNIYNEIIRDLDIGSIDEIRKDPKVYLELQKKIVYEKMKQEKEAPSNKLNIFDRSLADSLYYGMHYLDSASLGSLYDEYISNLIIDIKEHVKIIDFVIFFEPLEIPDTLKDNFRPKELKEKQRKERDTIFTLNQLIYPRQKIIIYNHANNIEEIINWLAILNGVEGIC